MTLMGPMQLRSRWMAVAAAAVAVLAVLGSMRWPLSAALVEPRLRQALQRDTEYAVESIGEASFRALPWPSIEVSDLALRKASSSHERALISKLKARLNLASWFTGDPQFVGLTLIRPVLHLASSEKLSETEALSAAVLNFIQNDKRPNLRKLRVSEAVILLDGKDWIRKLNIDIANVAASDLRLRANADYRGIPLALSADIAQGATRNGRQIAWSIAAPGALATFSGALFGARSFDAEGFFKVTFSDTGRHVGSHVDSLGLSKAAAGLLDGFRLSGNTKVAWPAVQIRNAAIQMGANRLDGSLEASFEHDPPRLSATLGAGTLNALALAERIEGLSPLDGKWSQEALPQEWLLAGQADLRLSVEKLLLGGITLEKAAVSAHLGAGRFEVILSDARVEKGLLKGRGAVTRSGQGFDTRASLSFDQLDLGLLQDASNFNRLRGLATGAFSFESTGGSMAQMVQAAQGRGNLSVKNGDIIGIDLERMLSRLIRDTPGEMPNTLPVGGRSRFQSLTTNLRMAAGIVTLFESQVSTLALRAPLEGTIDLNRQMFDLQARLLPAIDISRLGEAAIRIEGPWAKPVLTPEFTPRQNRSEIKH
jgi:AsmA protein